MKKIIISSVVSSIVAIAFVGCTSSSVEGNYKCSGSFGGGTFTLSENGKLKGKVFGDRKTGTWEKFDDTSIMIKGITRGSSESEFKIKDDSLILVNSSVQLNCKKQ
jgi:hypothetical protein